MQPHHTRLKVGCRSAVASAPQKWWAREDLHLQGSQILDLWGLLFPVNHAPEIGVPDRLRSGDLLLEQQACCLECIRLKRGIRLTKVDFPHIPQDRQCDHFPSDAGASISCRSRSSLPLSCFQWAMGPMETERLGRENAATGETNALDIWH